MAEEAEIDHRRGAGDAVEEAVQFLEREALVRLPEQEILGLAGSLQRGLKLLKEQLLQGLQLAGE
jgi:hypothetical protein